MIKKILLGLILIAVVLTLVGFLLPRGAHVERTIKIDRPPAQIFAIVNSMHRFADWSPWQHLDPNMKQSFDGPAEGVGAKMSWSGNDKVGSGTQTITASTPDKLVNFDVDFGKQGLAKASIKLVPDGSATNVTWTLDADMGPGPFGRYFGLMMDRMVGKDYESGLAALKRLSESS
jgi:uncharacterized protein YndB with AHSA1/START domain